jgi:methionine sulfoxide reductase heme-binding subunit
VVLSAGGGKALRRRGRTPLARVHYLAWAAGLYPLARMAWWLRDGVAGLGANPIERALHHTGWWALALLLATLAVTPARRITGRNELIRLRRPLGLFAFFYATLHLAIYLGLDQIFAWAFILEDVLERPFITVGLAAWLLLLPLAVTSTRGWIVRLGRRWVLLHKLIYLAAPLGLLHYFWRVRADTRAPALFALALLVLFALRIRWSRPRPHAVSPDRPVSPGAETGTGAAP